MGRSDIEQRYKFIDGLRGIAVLWVIFHHATYFFDVRPVFLALLKFFEKLHWLAFANAVETFYNGYFRLAFFGNYGVDLFFVISGFLITGLLIDFLDGKTSLRRFYLRRIFKIIPHYYAVILAVMVGQYLVSRTDVGQHVRSFGSLFLFLQNYGSAPDALRHTWSLVIEEQFYVFWAVFLWFLSRAIKTSEGRMRWAVSVGVALIILVNVYRFHFYHTNALLFRSVRYIHPVQMTMLRLDPLMAGCLLRLALPKIEAMAGGKIREWLVYVLGIVSYIVLLSFPVKEFGVPPYWYALIFAWLGTVCVIIAGLKGCGFVFWNQQLQWVGRSSYGIYLVHYPLLFVFLWVIGHGLVLNALFTTALYFAACVIAGWGTTQTVEKYFLHLRKRVAP